MTTERCPRCGKGPKVASAYTLNGVQYEDSYCGRCGHNWTPPKPNAVARDVVLALVAKARNGN